MLYGHRRDVEGYAKALERFDEQLPDILSLMKDEDILMITADHGCDPTHHGTDHTREHIPLLVAGKPVKGGVDLGVRQSFADIAATIYDYLAGAPAHACSPSLSDILEYMSCSFCGAYAYRKRRVRLCAVFFLSC